MGDPKRLARGPVLGVDFTYGAPLEPPLAMGRWEQHKWMNRPCCFLHFGVYRLVKRVPPGTRPLTLAGKRGRFLPAVSLAGGSRGAWWANHVWFFWPESRPRYAATLHYFGTGRETRQLLERLIRGLRPVAG